MCFVHTTSLNVTIGEYFITCELCDDSKGKGLPEKIKAAEGWKVLTAMAKAMTVGHQGVQATILH